MSDHPSSQQYTGWRKSRKSGSPNGNCVEVGFAADGSVGVRDSKDQAGPVLEFAPLSWAAFVAGVRAGDFGRQGDAG